MTRRPPPGICVHCLEPAERMNWDHVFPKSWYPDTTSHELEKWKIPSCIPCNTKYGIMEKEFLIRIGLCLDPNDPACSGIVAKALRSLDPRKARNNKDRKQRAKKRDQILSQMIPSRDVQSSAVYPGFEADRWPDQQLSAITLDSESHTKITEKIVRGILYLEESVFVGEDYTISTHVLHDQVALKILEKIAKHVVVHSRGPGITVLRATVPEDRTSSLFAIEIWGRFRSYSVVTKKSDSTN
jgi:hypothetical protein